MNPQEGPTDRSLGFRLHYRFWRRCDTFPRGEPYLMDTRDKILSRRGLHEVLEEYRHAGRRIVFASGVFDVLHAGHVRHLTAARAEGDLLVVGIHSDASARKLKGEGRPILTERARAALVAALAAVDYVVIFDGVDVKPLLREFQPDVHAIGAGDALDSAPERELDALLGIRVAVTGGNKQHSTGEILERVRRSQSRP